MDLGGGVTEYSPTELIEAFMIDDLMSMGLKHNLLQYSFYFHLFNQILFYFSNESSFTIQVKVNPLN